MIRKKIIRKYKNCPPRRRRNIRRLNFAIGLFIIIMISFYDSNPLPDFEFGIRKFEVDLLKQSAGDDIEFQFTIMGNPQKAHIIFGDGYVEELSGVAEFENAVFMGTVNHSYLLQGLYTPILQAWDWTGRRYTKTLELTIQNQAPLFDLSVSGDSINIVKSRLKTSGEQFYRIFEDEEVTISVLNISHYEEELTFIYDFGDSIIRTTESNITHAWSNQGTYTITVTVMGQQGELSSESRLVEVLNMAPVARFSLTNTETISIGEETYFNAEETVDTKSDYETLKFTWCFDNESYYYGMYASHVFHEPGYHVVSLNVQDDDGVTDSCSEIYFIEDTIPNVELIESLTVNEGDLVIFDSSFTGDNWEELYSQFYWNFDSVEFDPSNLSEYVLGGWKGRYVFEDDLNTTVSVAVIDQFENVDMSSTGVKVVNVAPEVNMYHPHVPLNVSFELIRDDPLDNCSFTARISNDQVRFLERQLFFQDNVSTSISTGPISTSLALDGSWQVSVMTNSLPIEASFTVMVKLQFADGVEIDLKSTDFTNGTATSWEHSLDQYLYDEFTHSYLHPYYLLTQVFDPSRDLVELHVTHSELKVLEIEYSDQFPEEFYHENDGIEYHFEFFNDEYKQFVRITACERFSQVINEEEIYPVNEDLELKFKPLVFDPAILMENVLGLTGVKVIGHERSSQSINTRVIDDDSGESSQWYNFSTIEGFKPDGNYSRKVHVLPDLEGRAPYGFIGSFLNVTSEGEIIQFHAKVNDDFHSFSSLRYTWDFGDGIISHALNPKHAWQTAGEYNITLSIRDAFGKVHVDTKTIKVRVQAPIIEGPFIFQAVEGMAVELDVEVCDSEKDEPCLEYQWFDDQGLLVSTEKTPSFILNDGIYVFKLVVRDLSGEESSAEITVEVSSRCPEVFVSSYAYYGVDQPNDLIYTEEGELTLRAYGLDTSEDVPGLWFYWTITDGLEKTLLVDPRGLGYSQVIFQCKETKTYGGEVRVVDPEGNEAVAVFVIHSTIDSTLDGVSDEMGEILRLSDGESDADGDGLTDTYEMTVSNTSYVDVDTDNDGLWDGYTINGSIGELSISTDPLDYDSDDDFLSDGVEYLGWNITVIYSESNTTTYHVTSDPLDENTDNDLLDDYEEYQKGGHPRMDDTDNEGLLDHEDPFVNNFDGDSDYLNDHDEIKIGTDYNSTDTDQDGLKDGEEYHGLILGVYTNPLDPDSDDDFLSDGAEIKNYFIKLIDEGFDDLDKKINLSTPASLYFPHGFEQASAAQISFGISFGEYGESGADSYGIDEDEVMNIPIIITKPADNLVLANFTTNSTRYFSQVINIAEILNDESYDYQGEYEIAIGIPKNGPAGNYHGTYFGPDFEFPETNWFNYSETGCYTEEVRDLLEGHSDVIKLHDDEQSTRAFIMYDDEIARGHGTAQFYFMITGHLSESGKTYVFDAGRDIYPYGQVSFYLDNGKWMCKDGNIYKQVPNVPDPELNTWYAIKIDWCRDGTAWEGLSNLRWQVSIDGTSSGAMIYNNGNDYDPTRFQFRTDSANVNSYSIYYDAFSFSWDDGYDEDECLTLDSQTYEYVNPGDFQATYSFEGETQKSETSISFVDHIEDNSVGACTVISSKDGFSEVLNIYDGLTYGGNTIINDFVSPQVSGTVEFYFRTDTTILNKRTEIRLQENGVEKVLLSFNRDAAGRLSYGDGTWHSITNLNSNQWYRFRIEFDCSSNTFDLYIDDALQGGGGYPFYGDAVSLDSTLIKTVAAGTNYNSYFEDISYSWSYSCFYLEYFDLEVCKYLDPNCNDTDGDGILDGVEVSGLVRGVEEIDFEDYYLATHDNETDEYYYNLTTNYMGQYHASYSFQYNDHGSLPTNWVASETGGSIQVSDCFLDHSKVLEFNDTSSSYSVSGALNFSSVEDGGVIEWWMATTDAAKHVSIELLDINGQVGPRLLIDNYEFQYDDGSIHELSETCIDNKFYHFKVVFNCSLGEYELFINNISQGTLDFKNSLSSIATIKIETLGNDADYKIYLDALGSTADWGYQEGDNLIDHSTNVINEYYLNLPDSGIVYDAELNLAIESLGNMKGNGILNTLLYKEAINHTLTDYLLLNETIQFSSGDFVAWDAMLDLFNVLYGDAGGNYLGTYFGPDFEFPETNWIDSCGGPCYIEEIRDLLEGHSDVIKLHDSNKNFRADMTYNDNIARGHGTVQFYFMITGHLSESGKTYVFDAGREVYPYGQVSFYIENGKWMCKDGSTYKQVPNVPDPELNTWYAIKIDWCRDGSEWEGLSDMRWKVSIDGTSSGAMTYNNNNDYDPTRFQFKTDSANTNAYSIYYDALSFSWDDGYDEEDCLTLISEQEILEFPCQGTYVLKTLVKSTIPQDMLNLTQFSINTETFITPNYLTNLGFQTDPANNDTDGDGWTDYKEIYEEDTSPLSADSDGDEAWDSQDRDPIRDYMLEIWAYWGFHYSGSAGSLLQEVISFEFGEEEYCIITPIEQTNQDKQVYFDKHYYINVDDSLVRQGATISIHIQLWWIRYPIYDDELLVDEYEEYSLGDVGDSFTSLYVGSPDQCKVRVKPVGMEKANTLAIYSANNSFTGHYAPNLRYSVIQLNVMGEGNYPGTHSFVEEQLNATGDDIDFVNTMVSGDDDHVALNPEVDGYLSVLEVTSSSSTEVQFDHNLGSHADDVITIEFWWRTTNKDEEFSLKFMGDGNTVIEILISDGYWKYNDGSLHSTGYTLNNDQWYHHSVFIMIHPYEAWHWKVNGTIVANDDELQVTPFDIDKIRFRADDSSSSFINYFDAFGYSTDPDYESNEECYSTDGTPFVNGMNVIVVPTELFTQTLLNHYVETETLDQTALYHPDEGVFEFTSNDRDGTVEEGNSDVDFVFVRHYISAEDAMEVLELLLWGMINETLDENNDTVYVEAIIHSYISTKLNGTMATQMNLPYSVLGYIPWYSTFTNDPMGTEPRPDGGFNLILWFLCLLFPVLEELIYAQVAMNGADFFKYLMSFVANIFMAMLTAVGKLLWTLARAALLVLFYVLLAIELLFISISVLTLAVPLKLISVFSSYSVDFGITWAVDYGVDSINGFLSIHDSEMELRQEKYITWIYWEFFDLYIPWVIENTVFNNKTLMEERHDIFGNEGSSDYDQIPETASEDNELPILFSQCFNETSTESRYVFRVKYYDPNWNIPDSNYGVRLHLVAPNGTVMEHYTMVEEFDDADYTSSSGVSFNYTADLSSYSQGLWHYFFSTKDTVNANITVYPIDNYFIGPDTSEGKYCLFGGRVTASDFYNDPEGWLNDDFNFYVTWYDMLSSESPLNVSMCLLPAKTDLGLGKNRTVGITKFEMSSTGDNFTEPVEYGCEVNLQSLGYGEDEIGLFNFYFEAITENLNVSTLYYSGIGDLHYKKVLVKPITKGCIEVELIGSTSYTIGNNRICSSDDPGALIATYSSYSSESLKEGYPRVIFKKLGTVVSLEYNMTPYWESTSETRYYINLEEINLPTGSWSIEIIALDVENVAPDISYSSGFSSNSIISIVGEVSQGLLTFQMTLLGLGLVPLVAHLGSLYLLMMGNKDPRFTTAGNALAVGTTAVALTLGNLAFITMYEDIENNIAQLIGFGIGCVFISLIYAYASSLVESGSKGISGASSLLGKSMKYQGIIKALSSISGIITLMTLSSSILSLFIDTSGLSFAAAFLSSGLMILKNSFALISMTLALGAGACLVTYLNSHDGMAIDLRWLKYSINLYKNGMFILSLVSFLCVSRYLMLGGAL